MEFRLEAELLPPVATHRIPAEADLAMQKADFTRLPARSDSGQAPLRSIVTTRLISMSVTYLYLLTYRQSY